jgi:flagellin
MGASQNRLQSAVSSIMNSKENLSAAESRIRDVDVAFETADLTRNSILQQAATSVLQQANTQPQIALSLLQG